MELPTAAEQDEACRLIGQILAGRIISNYHRAAASGPVEAHESAFHEAQPLEVSQPGKNAKKNRKKRERKAQKRREERVNAMESQAVKTSEHLGTGEADQTHISQSTASEASTEHGDPSTREQNSPILPYAEPQNLETPPKQNPQISLPSSSPATGHQTVTTTPRISKTPRHLMTPAVPFNLQFPKKRSVTMEQETLDTQRPAADQEGHSPELQIPVSATERSVAAAQTTTTDTQETEVAGTGVKAKIFPAVPPQEAEQLIPASAAQGSSTLPALVTATDAELTEIAQAGTKMAEPSPPAAPQETKQSILASLSAEDISSFRQITATGTGKPGSTGTEMAETPQNSSTEDQTQSNPASPAAETSESTESASALASLSINPAQTEASASGPSQETRITHAHPSIPAQATSPASVQSRLVQFDTYEWPCRNQECRKLTSPFDGSTVICPRCGPYSKIRYCSKKCLFDDALVHWGVECGQFTLAVKADPLTVTSRQVNIQPFIPSLTHHDRPERHRQMIRHSVDDSGDYFIFSDWMDWRAEGFPMPWPANKHASGSVLVVLKFTQTGSAVPSHYLFNRLIRVCFLIGALRTDMTYFLFKMIYGRLMELGLASEDAKNCLVWQFKHEFAFPGGFADLLEDERAVDWPWVAGEVVRLEAQYRSFLFGGAGLGPEWTNQV